MLGHTEIIDMLLDRKAPACVFVDTDPSGAVRTEAAHIWIEPGDVVRRLDLRCLLGLTVVVNGSDEKRVRQVIEAAQKAGAKTVFAYVTSTTGESEFVKHHARLITDENKEAA